MWVADQLMFGKIIIYSKCRVEECHDLLWV